MDKIYLLFIFIFFYLILIYFCNINKKEYFIENYKKYRLGDMIKLKRMRERSDGYKYHLKHFPNSIATEYMKKTDKSKNYKLLKKIVDKRTKQKHLKYKNYIILHLRTGDVLDFFTHNKGNNGKSFLKKKINKYVYPLSYYENIIELLKKDTNNKQLLILTGFHTKTLKNKNKNSLEYINGIEQFFKKKGFNVSKRINKDPDDDFIIMSNSKYFIKGGGGFSRIVSEIVKLNNNNIYEIKNTNNQSNHKYISKISFLTQDIYHKLIS